MEWELRYYESAAAATANNLRFPKPPPARPIKTRQTKLGEIEEFHTDKQIEFLQSV